MSTNKTFYGVWARDPSEDDVLYEDHASACILAGAQPSDLPLQAVMLKKNQYLAKALLPILMKERDQQRRNISHADMYAICAEPKNLLQRHVFVGTSSICIVYAADDASATDTCIRAMQLYLLRERGETLEA